MRCDATEAYFDAVFESEHDPYAQIYKDFEKSKYRVRGDGAVFGECLGIDIEDKRIVDIGCGIGTLTDRIARGCDPKYVCGVDISEVAVQRAIELYPEVMFFKKDICSEFFTLDIGLRFDVFLLVNVLSGIADMKIAAKNIVSIADGRFYMLIAEDDKVLIDGIKDELRGVGCSIDTRVVDDGQKQTIWVFQCDI